jgi:hypothetical protein
MYETVTRMAHDHERELSRRRVRYIGAVRRLDAALLAFDSSDIPMDPGRGDEPIPWTREHVVVIAEVAEAFAEVVRLRRDWDQLRLGGHRPSH